MIHLVVVEELLIISHDLHLQFEWPVNVYYIINAWDFKDKGGVL